MKLIPSVRAQEAIRAAKESGERVGVCIKGEPAAVIAPLPDGFSEKLPRADKGKAHKTRRQRRQKGAPQ